jgi:predicted nucleotidyltransferase
MAAIRQFARRIAARFHPQKIVLFGSYACGSPHEESDVDLLVIMPTRNAIDQSVRICEAMDRPFRLDLIVRTPGQIARALSIDDRDWFLFEVLEKGKVLYEAPHNSVDKQGRRRHGRGAHNGGHGSAAKRPGVLSLPAGGREIPQGAASRGRRRSAANARPRGTA